MSTNTPQSQRRAAGLWARLRAGPTASITHNTRWRWYEAVWAFLVIGVFGTTGRPVDLLVAVGLIGTWIIGPGISVAVAGSLAVIALGILPPSGWPLLATAFVLVCPVLIEFALLAPDRQVWSVSSGIVLAFTGLATAGIWVTLPSRHLGSALGGLYATVTVGLYAWFTRQEPMSDDQQPRPNDHSEPESPTPESGTQPETADTEANI